MLKIETYQSRIYLKEPFNINDRFQHFCFNGKDVFHWQYGSYLLNWNWNMLLDINAVEMAILRQYPPNPAW
jgi:hypothetical protein